jgi:heme-degrading monooxygenase HmoA
MYVAMNRFKVLRGEEGTFEEMWRSRDTYLHELPGFVEFALLKGPVREDHTLYASHTVWETHEHFSAWTRSEQFRRAHANAGKGKQIALSHPEFEGFEAILVEDNRAQRAAAE